MVLEMRLTQAYAAEIPFALWSLTRTLDNVRESTMNDCAVGDVLYLPGCARSSTPNAR